MENNEVKKELHQFVLSVVELVEKLTHSRELIRRVLFDGLEQSTNLEQMNFFLKYFKYIPVTVLDSYTEQILNICHKENMDLRELPNFTMTLRLLSDINFSEWDQFFSTLGHLNASQKDISDFLMTVRFLQENSFSDWVSFFKMIKSLSDDGLTRLPLLLRAFRHAIPYFKTERSLRGIARVLSLYPQYSEAFSFGQLDSKQWLMEEAIAAWGTEWGRVFVLAGWVGVLPRFIFEQNIKTEAVRSFDVDESVRPAAEILNQDEVQNDWIFKASTLDICHIKYPTEFTVYRKDGTSCALTEMPDVVINTSCEHLPNFTSWWSQIPNGLRVILQTNDGFHIDGHVSCFKNLNDFKTSVQLTTLHYAGEKALPEFNRFMLIGIK